MSKKRDDPTNPRNTGPFDISDTQWFYDQKGGILVVHEVWVGGNLFRTDTIPIPRRQLELFAIRASARKARRTRGKR